MSQSLFQRIATIFKAKANEAVDNLESPYEITKQAIRDLEDKLAKGVQAQVQIKSIIIEKQRIAEQKKKEASQWFEKANIVLDQVKTGALTQEEADKHAQVALEAQSEALHQAETNESLASQQQTRLDELSAKITEFKTDIENLKDKVQDLKTRETSANAMLEIIKSVSNIDGADDTKDLIKRMEDKVSHIENESLAYDALSDTNKTEKEKLNELVSKVAKPSTTDALAALKAQRSASTN